MAVRRGILLAGGSGTRLYPTTKTVSKQLMPIYDKPMVYYPLTTLMLAGIREILVITTPQDQAAFVDLLGSGEQWGIRLSYETQARPEGIAQALLIGADFVQEAPFALILGDNVFYGHGLSQKLQSVAQREEGATIFAYWVQDPERYGVVAFDSRGQVVSLEEKPNEPKSHYAVAGLYFYDQHAITFARSLTPSARGELEINDINLLYLRQHALQVELLGRGYAWLDTGTHDSLLEAAQYIATIQQRQGLMIACPEEIAYRMGYISREAVGTLGAEMYKNGYGQYLLQLYTNEFESWEFDKAEDLGQRIDAEVAQLK